MPAGALAAPVVCLVSAAAGGRHRGRLLLSSRSRRAVDRQHLLHERNDRSAGRRREHDAAAPCLRDRRGPVRHARAAHGAGDGRAAAASRLHAQPGRESGRRGTLWRHLVAAAVAELVVWDRLCRSGSAAAHGRGGRRSICEGGRCARGRQHRAPRVDARARARHGAGLVLVAVLQDHGRSGRSRYRGRGQQYLSPVDGARRAEGVLLPVALHGVREHVRERARARGRLGNGRRGRAEARREARRRRGDRSCHRSPRAAVPPRPPVLSIRA